MKVIPVPVQPLSLPGRPPGCQNTELFSNNSAQFTADVFPEEQEGLRYCTSVQADGEGFEPPVRDRVQQFSRLPTEPEKSGVSPPACHLLAKSASDLERLADAWDTLPEEVRAKIREMVEGK